MKLFEVLKQMDMNVEKLIVILRRYVHIDHDSDEKKTN